MGGQQQRVTVARAILGDRSVAERTVQLFDGRVVDKTDAERSVSAEGLVESGFEG